VKFQLNLRQLVHALSDTLDMVGVDDRHHGKRVAFMARECARVMGLDGADTDDLVVASLLHDCGVSSTRVHLNLVNELDWSGSQDHCHLGHQLLSSCEPFTGLAEVILYHHTHADRLKALELPTQTALFANLIFLTDRVDALIAQAGAETPLLAKKRVRKEISRYQGSLFRDDLVELFLSASERESFWLSLEAEVIDHFVDEWTRAGEVEVLPYETLKSVANLFSVCVDAKSRFTAEHSHGVASLARHIGDLCGLPEHSLNKLELAGLLHDIGKLRVPDEILEKPGRLDEEEFTLMERHSFDTLNVLGRIDGLEDIALWASQHHEDLRGTGYPFKNSAETLSLEARILKVADVFQALAQNRPYRDSLTPEEILTIQRQMVLERRLDGKVVEKVAGDLEGCWRASLHAGFDDKSHVGAAGSSMAAQLH
jgi:HD-GYP domain-containing protein (c-di-GMP phosphodiesterase class II)